MLVLDDYHLIDAPPIHQAIGFLLDHLSPQLHLVIASRADPSLPLSRLRARGQLAELRASDLRFTADEAVAFYTGVLGMTVLDRPDFGFGGYWLEAGGQQLHLMQSEGRRDGGDHFVCPVGQALEHRHRVLNIPGLAEPGGLPLGVQIVGRFGRDRNALEAARFVEQAIAARTKA